MTPPPVWTMLKKNALFLHRGFPKKPMWESNQETTQCHPHYNVTWWAPIIWWTPIINFLPFEGQNTHHMMDTHHKLPDIWKFHFWRILYQTLLPPGSYQTSPAVNTSFLWIFQIIYPLPPEWHQSNIKSSFWVPFQWRSLVLLHRVYKWQYHAIAQNVWKQQFEIEC